MWSSISIMTFSTSLALTPIPAFFKAILHALSDSMISLSSSLDLIASSCVSMIFILLLSFSSLFTALALSAVFNLAAMISPALFLATASFPNFTIDSCISLSLNSMLFLHCSRLSCAVKTCCSGGSGISFFLVCSHTEAKASKHTFIILF